MKAVRDGVWRVDVEVGRDAVTGRRRRVSRNVYGTRHDAEVAAVKLKIADHEHRLVTGKTSARSIGALMTNYVESVEGRHGELAPSTVVTIRSAVSTMSDQVLLDGRSFGSIRLSKLTWRDIEALYAAMASSGRGTAWVRRCATVLSQALEFGRKRGLVDSNPAKDAQRPKTLRSKPFSPTLGDVRAAIAAAERTDPEIADLARLLIATGMRRGELLAIRVCDISFDDQLVNVSAALVDGGRGVGIVRKATKTSDWRDAPLNRTAMEAIARQPDRRANDLDKGEPDRLLMVGDRTTGTPLRPDRLTVRWAAARGTSQLTLQHLRHFAATAMLDAGESYRTVADLLGNSESTLRLHYDGRNDTGKRQAVEALDLG